MTQPQHPYIVVRPTSAYAVAALIFGILAMLGFCLPIVGTIISVVAVILGHAGLIETKSGLKSGHGMSIAGLIMGYLCFVPSAIFIFTGGLGTILGQ